MKSLHLKKLAGMGEKMRTWGKSSDADQGSSQHSHRHHHSHSQPPPQAHHHHSHHHQRSPSPPPPDEFTQGSSADEAEAVGDPSATPSPPLTPGDTVVDSAWEPPMHTVEHDLSLLDDTPLLPELPPLPRSAISKRRSSVPHVLSRHSGEGACASPTEPPNLLLLDINGGGHPLGASNGHMASSTTTTLTAPTVATSEKSQKLEEKIKELKLRDLARREDVRKERERRKELEHQLKAAQKERYIQGLKVKYLETKLEKVGGNKSDMEKRVRKESHTNASLQKEVDALRAKLAERDRALAERDDALAKMKRQYLRIKQGGSDDCTLEELDELVKMLEKSLNVVLDRIKQKLKEEADDKAKCLICFDRTKAIIFVPCGHRVCCAQCSNQVKTCPMCRANIEIKQKVFE